MKAITVIRNARKKHFIKVKATDDIKALVCYALHVGYANGWKDRKKLSYLFEK